MPWCRERDCSIVVRMCVVRVVLCGWLRVVLRACVCVSGVAIRAGSVYVVEPHSGSGSVISGQTSLRADVPKAGRRRNRVASRARGLDSHLCGRRERPLVQSGRSLPFQALRLAPQADVQIRVTCLCSRRTSNPKRDFSDEMRVWREPNDPLLEKEARALGGPEACAQRDACLPTTPCFIIKMWHAQA